MESRFSSIISPATIALLFTLLCTSNAWPEAVPVPSIPPGAVIQDKAPAKWTHMIVKSLSRVCAGDIRKVPANDVRMANKFNTVFLANVRQDTEGRFHLANLGVGTTVCIDGQDIVVDPKSHETLGANLSFFESVLLKAIHKRQANVSLAGYRPTFGIVDVPAAIRWNRVNQQMVIRYGLIVDAQNGHLNSMVWLVDPLENAMASPIQCLPPNCIDHCRLYVDAGQYRFGKLPTEVAYAATSIPRGTSELTPTQDIVPLLSKRTYTPKEVVDVESHLRVLHSQQIAQRPNATVRP